MKKVLKKALLGLALVPCMFTVGCFGGDAEPTLEEKQNSAYTNLRTLVVSEKLVDNTKNIAYTENGHEKMTMYMDYSKSGLKETTVDSIKAELGVFGMGGTVEEPLETDYSSIESFGYKTDGTGYREYKQKNSANGEWYLNELSVTKKVGDKYVDYQFDINGDYDFENSEWVPTNYAFYVGTDYAKHEFTFNMYDDEQFDLSGASTGLTTCITTLLVVPAVNSIPSA